MPLKGPNPVDKHVGSRVRMRRLMMSLSQEKLADGLGITFQQVQKYEKGVNRIGASRLQQMSQILQCPVAFFFEGAPVINPVEPKDPVSTAHISEFLASRLGIDLTMAFQQIKDSSMRRRIVELVQEIAEGQAA